MNQELQKLFKEIVGVQGKDPSPYFYDKWLKLCDKHDLQTVVKAWDDISRKCDSWKYYELNVWRQKLEYYEPTKKEPEPEYVPYTSESIQSIRDKWKAMSSGKYTRRQLMDMGLVDKRTILMWENPRYPLDKPPFVYDEKAYKKWLKENHSWILKRNPMKGVKI